MTRTGFWALLAVFAITAVGAAYANGFLSGTSAPAEATRAVEHAVLPRPLLASFPGSKRIDCYPDGCVGIFLLTRTVTDDRVLSALRPWAKKMVIRANQPIKLTFLVKISYRTIGGMEGSDPMMVTCSRDAVAQIDWDHVQPTGIRTLCDVRNPSAS